MPYLNEEGLAHLWQLIQAYVADHSGGEGGTSKQYEVILAAKDWIQSDNKYYQEYTNQNLICKLSPIVAPISNKEEYSYLDTDKTEATSQVGITFWANKKPEHDITILIQDIR